MKVACVALWVISITRSCVEIAALSFPKASRDLESSETATSLQDTQDQIASCPQCRSADEVQQSGLLRDLLGQGLLWWVNRTVTGSRFVDALKDTEIPVNATEWASVSHQWTASAQTLRQQDANGSSTTSPDGLLQYEHLLTDLSASSLEASSTLMNMAGFDQMNGTVPLDQFSCRIVTMMNFLSRNVLSNIAVVGDAWYSVSAGSAKDEVSSLVQELLKNSTSPFMDRYTNALLTYCATNDESFVRLQDTAETLAVNLTEKRNAILLYSGDQSRPSVSTDTTSLVLERIERVLSMIFYFPLLYFLVVPWLLFCGLFQEDYPILVDVLFGIGLILLIIIAFPVLYIYSILCTLLGGSIFGETLSSTMDSGSTPDMIAHMTLLKRNPFLYSVDDIECQVQKTSCESEAWVQVFAPSP